MANITHKNYFNPRTVAERYFKGRPQYHSFVIGKIKESLSIEKPFSFALDVGCGTGFSSVALKEISDQVVGLDISAEMLGFAKKANAIEYISASAENLPLCGNKFDLITVSQAIHWIDKQKFFVEADRILKPKSFIIAYDNYFSGRISDNPEFDDWYKNQFLKLFPIPPRGKRSFEKESENPKDFLLAREEWHENTIEFSKQQLIDFLITITNVINLVENGEKSIDEVSNWLADEIKTFFTAKEKNNFVFTAPIWYLKQSE